MYRRQGPGFLTSLVMLALLAAGILAILSVIGVIDPIGSLFGKPEAKLSPQGPTIVQQLRARNEWITFSYTADQLLEAKSEGNFLQNLLYGDRILLQARGEVAGGIDMAQLRDDQIVISGTAITMTLPPAEIIYSKLDNSQTRVYDRELGWLNKGDITLESQLRAYAEQAIVASACEAGVLDRAATEAQKNVQELLSAVGYTSVTINVTKVQDCVGSANIAAPGQPQGVNPTAPPAVPTVGLPGVPVVTAVPGSNGLTGTISPVTPQP
jgi:hypothetical protein